MRNLLLCLLVVMGCGGIDGDSSPDKVGLDTEPRTIVPAEWDIAMKEGGLAEQKISLERGNWRFIGFMPRMSRDGTKLPGVSIDGNYNITFRNNHDTDVRFPATLKFVDVNGIPLAETDIEVAIIPAGGSSAGGGNFRIEVPDMTIVNMIHRVDVWAQARETGW